MLEKKEDDLRSDEVNLEKEYDITTRILKSAQAQMDETIANKDMVGIHVSRELIEVATKKLDFVGNEKFRSTNFSRLLKKQITVIGNFFSSLSLCRLNISLCS